MIYYDYTGNLQAKYNEIIIEQNNAFDHNIGYGLNGAYTRLNKQKVIDWSKHWCGYDKYLWKDSTDNDIKISVITLIYKANKSWLLQSIFSSLWQITSFRYKLELIFVCDPNWTEENEWLLEIAEKYPDVNFKIILNEKSQGYAKSYNIALDNAAGDYVFITDCDDLRHPESFEWAVKLLEENTELMGVSFTPVIFKHTHEFYDINRVELGRPAILNSPVYTLLDATLLRYADGRPFLRINPQAICYRKDIAKNIRIEDKYCDLDNQIPQMDRVFIMHCLKKYPFGFMQNDRCLLFHRVHNDQVCGKKYKFIKNCDTEIAALADLSGEIIKRLNPDTINVLSNIRDKVLKGLQ